MFEQGYFKAGNVYRYPGTVAFGFTWAVKVIVEKAFKTSVASLTDSYTVTCFNSVIPACGN